MNISIGGRNFNVKNGRIFIDNYEYDHKKFLIIHGQIALCTTRSLMTKFDNAMLLHSEYKYNEKTIGYIEKLIGAFNRYLKEILYLDYNVVSSYRISRDKHVIEYDVYGMYVEITNINGDYCVNIDDRYRITDPGESDRLIVYENINDKYKQIGLIKCDYCSFEFSITGNIQKIINYINTVIYLSEENNHTKAAVFWMPPT